MRILIIGGGGREHALAWRLSHEGHEVHAAPGSDGIAAHATCHREVGVGDAAAVVAVARDLGADLAVVGPEQPLVDGLADALRDAGVAVFGPSAKAARLEGSKAEAKRFMAAHSIPTARHVTVHDFDEAQRAIATFETPPVVKADGLAAGKGVTVASTHDEAREAARAALVTGRFGDAGRTCVLEERLLGQEASYFVLTDGTSARTLAPAQDHKRIGEGDTGPNTGGMGAYAPAPVVDAAVRERIDARIVAPTLRGLAQEGHAMVGVLFVGLMIDDAGEPKVIEYNVRFGDPEIQPLLYGLREPIGEHLRAAATGGLTPGVLASDPAATIVMASAGYPASSSKGDAIVGLDEAAGHADVMVFHAGTRRGSDGGWQTAGGRVLGVCARASTLGQAVARAYAAADEITFPGAQMRRDIAARALG